jgi:hypothetical protein
VINVGLWYHIHKEKEGAWFKRKFTEDLTRLFSLVPPDRTVLRLGPPKSHFLTENGLLFSNKIVLKENGLRTSNSKCRPSLKTDRFDAKFDPYGVLAAETALYSNVRMEWIDWSEPPFAKCALGSTEKTISVIPHVELSAPFFRNHLHDEDCSHYCWSPLFYQPFWDAIFLAFRRSLCTELEVRAHPVDPKGPPAVLVEKNDSYTDGFAWELTRRVIQLDAL